MNKAILILAILAFSLSPTALSSPMKESEDKDRELISINLGTLLGGLFGGTKNTTTTTPSNNTSSNNNTATTPAANNTSSNNNTTTPPANNNTNTTIPPANNNTNTTIPPANNNTNSTIPPANNNTNSTIPPANNNTNSTIPPATNNTNTTVPPTTNNTNTTTPVTPPTPIKYAKNDVYMPNFPTDCLRVHNEQRSKVGLGDLTWSADLAKSAQAWAENMAVNGFRHSGKPGENIASTSYSTYTLGRLLGMWVHEQDHYIVGCKYPKCSTTSAEVGHYTQMVWHSTTQVGCGFAPGANRGYNYLCCQYYKAGNIVGQYVY